MTALDKAPRGLAFTLGARLVLGRLRRRRTLAAAVAATLLAAVGAWIERSATSLGAADRALAGTLGLVVPLFAIWVAGVATERLRFADAAWPVARFGLDEREVGAGMVVAASTFSALASALFAATTVVVAHSPTALTIAADAMTSAGIGLLGGAAYACWFMAGATVFRGGNGRFLVFVIDFALGHGSGLVAALLPRGHVANLLGGVAPLGLGQRQSSFVLVAMCLVLTMVTSVRSRRRSPR